MEDVMGLEKKRNILSLCIILLIIGLLLSSCRQEPHIEIGYNGNWWINGQDTGTPATGPEGPQGPGGGSGGGAIGGDGGSGGGGSGGGGGGGSQIIIIGSNGNWWINGNDTGTPATGPAGQDGAPPAFDICGDKYVWINNENTGINLGGLGASLALASSIDVFHNGNLVTDVINISVNEMVYLTAEVGQVGAAIQAVLWEPRNNNIALDGFSIFANRTGTSAMVEGLQIGRATLYATAIVSGNTPVWQRVLINVNAAGSYAPGPIQPCNCNYDYDTIRAVFAPVWIGGIGGYQITTFTRDDKRHLRLPSCFNGQEIRSIAAGVFQDNQTIYSVHIPNTIVTIGNNAFRNTGLIYPLYIPRSVTTIGVGAFADNPELTTVSFNAGLVTIGNNAFQNNALTSVDIPNTVTVIGTDAFRNNRISSVNLGNVVTIGVGAFMTNQISGIVFPPTLSSIGGYAFNGNRITGTVTIPGNVAAVGANAFSNGNHITELIFAENRVNTTIGVSAFVNNHITRLVIPNGIVSIGDWAFHNNRISGILTIPGSLTSLGAFAFVINEITEVHFEPGVNIPHILTATFERNRITQVVNMPNVTTIGNAAFFVNELESITIPNTVTTIGNNAFRNNRLTSVVLGSSVVSIGVETFAYNYIENLVFPPSVVSLGWRAFVRNQITSLDLGNLGYIAPLAFQNNRLSSVVIPASLTYVQDRVFATNTLSTITIRNQGGITFYYNNPGTMGNWGASFIAFYIANGRQAGTYSWRGGTDWDFVAYP